MKKLTRSEAIEIVKEFVSGPLEEEEWFVNIKPFVKAVIFYGSTSKELNRPDSDLDILLIVPIDTEEKYAPAGEYYFNYKGREIDVVLRSIEKLRVIAKEGKDEFQAEVFRMSEIIWESDNEIREIIKKLMKLLEK